MSDLSRPWEAAAPADDAALGALLDAIAVPAWLHRDGQPLRTNPALQRLVGLSPLALQHTPHLAMVVPADRASLDAATTDCLTGSGEPPAQTAQLQTANGSLRPVELTLRRIPHGGQAAALVTCVDLSDFQHVQAMLQATSGLLRQIVDGAPMASFVIDSHHRITHWNSACERLTACPAELMIGSKDHWRAFYAQARPLLADWIVDDADPVLQGSLLGEVVVPSSLVTGAYETEAFFAGMGGTSGPGRWINFTAAPLRDQAGQVVGAIVTLQDVSERRRTEAELHRQLDELVEARSAELAASARVMDAFIDNAPIGVVHAVRSHVLRHNRQMTEIFGLAADGPDPVPGRAFYFAQADAAALRAVARPLLACGEPLHHEMWMHHASGRPMWVQVNAYVIDRQDPEAGTWWMLQDRTEMRAAQEALRERFEQLQAAHHQLEQTQNQLLQSDKMASIGQLAAGVAHEINNPVGFVSSNLHTLRQYVQSLMAVVDAYGRAWPGAAAAAAPADAEHLARALQAAELDYLKEDLPALMDESADGLARVKKIVQDLKDFSRVDQADWQQADLNAGLESTLNVVRHEVKYKAEVLKRLGELPLVNCLAGQLNQVFLNLIVNASQAIGERGTITIASGTDGPWAWVQVDDTGCGMSEEVQRRIFEPFFTTKDVGKGTGLGLSLSFSIIKRHAGHIRVRSVPGHGSSFRVWVPLDGPASSPPSAPHPPPDWP